MLVVSRKKHDFIQIGEEIVIKVIKTSRNSVKIGIDAPGGLRIIRGELTEDEFEFSLPIPSSRVSSGNHMHETEKPQPAEVL